MTSILAAWTVAAAIALAAPLVLYPALKRSGIIDEPNHRSSHTISTTRGGGVAQVLAIGVGGVIAAWGLAAGSDRNLLSAALGAGVLVGLLGLVEDARGVRIATRAGTQVLIGLLLGLALVWSTDTVWWLIPIAGIAFAAYVNFSNFMDGINGISGLHGGAVGGIYAVLGLTLDLDWLTTAGGLIAVVYLAFLPWNFLPPGVFLGDVGSYLLGGAIAGTALAALAAGVSPLAILAPLSIYIADTTVVILRRLLRGEAWFEAHRQHVYQRLVDNGRSHLSVALMVTLFTFAAGVIGVVTAVGNQVSQPLAWCLVLLLAASYVGLPKLLKLPSLEEN